MEKKVPKGTNLLDRMHRGINETNSVVSTSIYARMSAVKNRCAKKKGAERGPEHGELPF